MPVRAQALSERWLASTTSGTTGQLDNRPINSIGIGQIARPLWRCPRCGKQFTNKNTSHSCTTLTLDEFFASKTSRVRELFDALHEFIVATCGEVLVNVDKTRITFQARTRFAAVPRVTKEALIVHFWLRREVVDPRIERVEALPPNNFIHYVRVTETADLDWQLAGWISEAFSTTGGDLAVE